MDTQLTVATIAAAAAVIAPAVSFYLTKSKERKAEWQRYKFELYKEFVESLSGIVDGDDTPDGHRRYASICNTLHLIGSENVLRALLDFQDEISVSNTNRSRNKHDAL